MFKELVASCAPLQVKQNPKKTHGESEKGRYLNYNWWKPDMGVKMIGINTDVRSSNLQGQTSSALTRWNLQSGEIF